MSRESPAVFASPRFAEAAANLGAVSIRVDVPDLTRVVQFASSTRGKDPNIGAVTLQLRNELPRINPKFYPITPGAELGTTEPVRLGDIRDAASEQDLRLFRIRSAGLSPYELRQATYLKAGRGLGLWFGGMSGGIIGLAADVVENGIRDEFSFPRLGLYIGAGAILGLTAGGPLMIRGKHRYDRDILADNDPIRLL